MQHSSLKSRPKLRFSRRAASAAAAVSALLIVSIAAVTAQPRGGGFGPGGAPGGPGAGGPRGGGFGGPGFGDPASALDAPFVGLTTDGTPVAGLFEITP